MPLYLYSATIDVLTGIYEENIFLSKFYIGVLGRGVRQIYNRHMRGKKPTLEIGKVPTTEVV